MTSTECAGIHQVVENLEQHAHIVEVQAGGRFIEEEERRFAYRPRWSRKFREVTDQLQTLAFAAGERVDRLARAANSQPDFLQQLQTLPPRAPPGAIREIQARKSMASSTVASRRSAMDSLF